MLIRKYLAAPIPALESYFKLVLFNYLFSNGDAHLKNFSIIRSAYGDYMLTPAYDLMCTVLHAALESDTALDLYNGDMEDAFYGSHGYYGRPHFDELAKRIGILPRRADKIIENLLNKKTAVEKYIDASFLKAETKKIYYQYFKDKLKRFE